MSAIKRHNLKLNPVVIKQIDYIMPKLKYSVNYRKVMRWLENFEEGDVDKAIDFLFYLEYIDTTELTFRLHELLQMAFKVIPKDHYVYIYPSVATYPKSTEVINYIIKTTPAFELRASQHHCLITRDLEKDVIKRKKTTIILVDDFIGTGKSFEKGYGLAKQLKSKPNKKIPDLSLKQWLDKKRNVKHRFLISSICMNQGRILIEKKYPEIEIFSEFREQVFEPITSPFRISSDVEIMKEAALKYGSYIKTIGRPPYSTPLGFNKCACLVAFNHTTPNNTLPIIWGSSNWFPIFPRFGKDKVKQAREIKKEVAYYIGIMNRLKIVMPTNEALKLKSEVEYTYSPTEDHSLLCVLKLQQDGYEAPTICQLLGITIGEYKSILAYGKIRKLIDRSGKISTTGLEFYRELMKRMKSKRFLKKDKELFEMKVVNYIPGSFGGLT